MAIWYAYQIYVIPCKEIGLKNVNESGRAILVDHYFASKSHGHDVTLMSFAANLWYVRNLYLHIGCNIDVPKGTASFALIAPLVWQISRKSEGATPPPSGPWAEGPAAAKKTD